jgi:uncharacterized protein YfaS (alpha-2-macroglobulin family)
VEYTTIEENIKPTSSGLKLARTYTVKGSRRHVTQVAEGSFITVELTLTSDAEHEYAMISDNLPSGAQVLLEREQADFLTKKERGTCAHWEIHDEKVVFFLTKLPAGVTRLKYVIRAAIPGEYHAVPAVAELMYFPEIRGTSAETILTVSAK